MAQGKIDRFSRELDNGRFLIRPFGFLGGVHEVEADAKDRFLKYRRISGLPTLAIFIGGSLLGVDPIPVLVAICLWLVADIMLRQSYVKRGTKVGREQWTPLPEIDTGPLFPRWAYLIFVPILLALEYASLGGMYQLYVQGPGVPIESWVFVALWTYLLWLCWTALRRYKKRPASPRGAGPDNELEEKP